MNTIDHPQHYGGEANPFETIKIIEALGWGEGFCLGNALKYIMRAGKKSGVLRNEDLEKAIWYLKRVLESKTVEKATAGEYVTIPDSSWEASLESHEGTTADRGGFIPEPDPRDPLGGDGLELE